MRNNIEEKSKRIALRKIAMFFFILVLFVLMGFSGKLLIDRAGAGEIQWLGLAMVLISILPILLLLIGFWFTFPVLIHELGHALAAKLVGWEFQFLVAGPFGIRKLEAGMEFCRVDGWLEFPGWAGSYPLDLRNLRRNTAFVYAGGPLASLLLLLALVAFRNLSGVELGRHNTSALVEGIYLLAMPMYTFSLVTFIIPLLPFKTKGIPTDGYALLILAKGGEQAQRLCFVSFLEHITETTTRPKHWDASMITMNAQSEKDDLDKMISNYAAYLWALDSKQVNKAKIYLDVAAKIAEKYHYTDIPFVILEKSYFEARYCGNVELAKELLERSESPQANLSTRSRAKAAIWVAEGQFERAAFIIREAQSWIESTFKKPPGIIKAELDWLNEMQHECRTK